MIDHGVVHADAGRRRCRGRSCCRAAWVAAITVAAVKRASSVYTRRCAGSLGRLGAREEATSRSPRAGELRLTDARVNPGIRKYALPESTSAPSGSTGRSYLWIQELSRAERSFVHRLDLAGRARTSTRTRCLSAPSMLIFLSLVRIKNSAERGAAGGFPY